MIVYQRPNLLLIAAAVLSVAGRFINHGLAHAVLAALAIIGWVCWSYDEIRRGDGWFRRALGSVVLVMQFIGLVR